MKAALTVIGGGIIGLTIAATLQRRGVAVLLLDQGDIGRGASWGNAGHIATEQVYPVADLSMLPQIPAMLLNPLGPLRLDWRYLPRLLPWALRTLWNMRPAAARRIHQALLAINGASLAAWQQFAEDLQLRTWLRVEGSILVCEREKTRQRLQQHGATLNRLGVENNWLEANELRQIAPALAENQLGGLYYPQTAHITDLAALHDTLLRAFSELGGSVCTHCRVLGGKQDDSGVTLQTSDGNIRSDYAVLAAGAYSRPLAQALTGVRVALDTERGYHLMLPKMQALLPIPVSSADRRFIMTPMAGGLRLAGTVEYAGLAAPANMARARHLLPLAQGMLKAPLTADGAQEWMGFRPTTADSLPVIDRDGRVLLAFGHQHLGLTQAALTAEAVAALYSGSTPPLDLQPFALRRFA